MSGLPLPVALRVAKARALQLEAAVDRAAQGPHVPGARTGARAAASRRPASWSSVAFAGESRPRAIAERDDALGAAARAEAAAHERDGARRDGHGARAAAPSTVWAPRSRRGTARAGLRAGHCRDHVRRAGVADRRRRTEPARGGCRGRARKMQAAPRPPTPRSRGACGIPARYLALYQDAARRDGLDYVAGGGRRRRVSTTVSLPLRGVLTGSNPRGAAGPAQFLAGDVDALRRRR